MRVSGNGQIARLPLPDRADADGAGANAAGMAFLLIGGAEFPSFDEVVQRLFADSPRVR